MVAGIPVVDLKSFKTDAQLAQALGEAFTQVGFVLVTNHNLSPVLLDKAYSAARRLFALPDERLRRYETPLNGRQTGFASFGAEQAKNKKIGDLKRYWMVRRQLPLEHPRRSSLSFVENIWPVEEVPEFRPAMLRLFDSLDALGNQVLSLLSIYLGYEKGFLPDVARDGETVLRVLHYPPIAPGAEGVRSAAHEDINLITLLPAATARGLQVKNAQGDWIDVQNEPDAIVVNIADMLQILCGGRLRSTTHQVINTETQRDRFSMPFFVHARGEVVLDPVTGLTAAQCLQERLDLINRR